MVKVHTGAKYALLLLLWIVAAPASAQRYGNCGYGTSVYNNNICKTAKPITLPPKRDDTLTVKTTGPPPAIPKVYPNPAGHYFMLQLPPQYLSQAVTVELYNNTRDRVLARQIKATSPLHKIQLPLLANGLYEVRISTTKNTQTILLDIQN